MKIIDIGFDITHIIHTGDIHIRNVKRQKEYKIVFDRFIDKCKELKQLHPNTVIYLGGDIVHSKLDLSPESVNLTQYLLKELADIAPVLMITGNHDCNLNNTYRMDALTPIVEAINSPNIHYLKDSGHYRVGDVDFAVMSLWDHPKEFLNAVDVGRDGKTSIALHHGAVDHAVTDLGFLLNNEHLTTSKFEGFDLTLLADIHKRQFLNDDKTQAYCGSLIQQNHAETLDKGFLHWELKNKKATYHPIQNDYGYVTIDIKKGKPSEPKYVPTKPRIRLRIQDTDTSVLKTILTDIKTKYSVTEVAIQKINNKNKNSTSSTQIDVGNVRDAEFQNKLIEEYLTETYIDIDKNVLNVINNINRETNKKVPEFKQARNCLIKLKHMKFENMFSYGPDNYVNFEDMTGTYGLFAPNTAGKTSLLEILLFTWFDRCSKTNHSKHVMNNKKDSFFSEICWEMNGHNYFVQRIGKRHKKGNVKVLVDFWVEIDGVKQNLNGHERKETNQNIKQYIGTYEDFVLTSLSLQSNTTGFIEMIQSQRKQLLGKFLDIHIFEDLKSIATDDIKEVSVLLKKLKKEDISSTLSTIKKKLKTLTTESKLKINECKDLTDKILTVTTYIDEQKTLIKTIEDNVTTDIDVVLTDELKLQKALDTEQEYLVALNTKLSDIKTEFDNIKTLLGNVDEMELNKKSQTHINNQQLLDQKYSEQTQITNKISHYDSKLTTLSTHKYDPNCKWCVNNVFVKDANETKKLKISATEEFDILYNEIEELEYTVKESQQYDTNYTVYKQNQTKKINTENDYNKLLAKRNQKQIDINDITLELTTNKNTQILYRKNEEDIEYNKTINTNLIKYNTLRDDLLSTSGVCEKENTFIYGEIQVCKSKKIDCENKIKELKSLETEYVAYEKYLEAIDRNGVPFQLISNALPKIENEVNSILSQIVEFTINLETDGKNINAYICESDTSKWPLELTSGAEKFISSVALRTAFSNISNLPRPNFIAIDEGMGTLDAHNLNNIQLLFDYLKTQFDWVLIVSHISTIRDFVDKQLSITKTDSYSNIKHY